MTTSGRDPLAERVLVHAPTGRDGELSSQVLTRAGIWNVECPKLDVLCDEIAVGAATIVITEEALTSHSLDRLSQTFGEHQRWSDLPVVLCTTGGDVERSITLRARALEELGNVLVVERPMQTRTLLAAVNAGLRARRRQLSLRDVVVELEEANRAKDEFLAMISHELRTPLNAMLGWSRLLLDGNLPEAQRARALQTIERNAVAQAKLIEELLDVSRIISHKLRLSQRALDLRSIVDASVDSSKPAAEAKGLVLDLHLPSDAAHVMGDAERLTQVVSNLVGNAIKFTPAGGNVVVTLETSARTATLTVRDDGIGIRPEFVAFVFDRFRQADGSRTRAHGGLGLGLAIVRELVELHGGEVHAASEGVGKGAELTMRLPLIAEERLRTLRGSERPAATPQGALTGIHVVVVDDESDARDLVSAVLERAGALVTPVGSADEAMHAIRERAPSLLVSDIGMPGEDGYALIARVRALPADRGGRVPAVAVTAFTRPSDRTRALRAGYTAHLGKPIDPSELVTLAAGVTSLRASD